MKVRTPYNYDRNEASKLSGVDTWQEPSKAVQSAKEECDINVIVKRFRVTGHAPQNVRAPQFGDFTGVYDFQSAMNAIIEAENSFMQMPAAVRAKFYNDPQRFLEFCSAVNEDGTYKNLEEMRKMGLTREGIDDIVTANSVSRGTKENRDVSDESGETEDGVAESASSTKGSARSGERVGKSAEASRRK